MIEIEEKRYEELLLAERKLNALEASGVDNWEGYGDAMAELEDEEDEG